MSLHKPRVLVVTHVHPFPGDAGQQQRVANTLKGLRAVFEVDVVTFAEPQHVHEIERALAPWCDRAIVLPSAIRSGTFVRIMHTIAAGVFVAWTGLKSSNHTIGNVEFSPRRLGAACTADYNLVLFEYWHAAASTRVFRARGIPCVLDMHDVLLRSYERALASRSRVPDWWKRRALRRYAAAEIRAWEAFDAIIAINEAEAVELRAMFKGAVPVFYTPMGVDMEYWSWDGGTSDPPRLVYYGGLGNPANQADAILCLEHVMPRIWRDAPRAEFWMLGGNPPEKLQSLAGDPRVHVPGYVEDIRPLLGRASIMLCPFTGRFGFRSRVVEALALGVPVIASEDAVHGMNFTHGEGVHIAADIEAMAETAAALLADKNRLLEQRVRARSEARRLYGFDASYGRLARDLGAFLAQRHAHAETPEVSA